MHTKARRGGTAPQGSRTSKSELPEGSYFAGRYRILGSLGRGGMGAVYHAVQEPLGREVAIKVLSVTANSSLVARFEREARVIARLNNPHIVGVIDFGSFQDQLYLVMDYVKGEPLTQLMRRELGKVSPKRIVDIGLQIADALSAAHALHIVHRDIKPDNIMVTRQPTGRDFVTVLDFGVAKITDQEDDGHQTRAGVIVGSPRYMAPEQVASGKITPSSDIYALGCVLYEMLTGKGIFSHTTTAEYAIAHIREAPAPPESQGIVLEGPLVDFVMKCLAKEPADRPKDAQEAIRLLEQCRVQPLTQGPEVDEEDMSLRAPIPDSSLTALPVAPVGGGMEIQRAQATQHAAPLPQVSAGTPVARPRRRKSGTPAWLFVAIGLAAVVMAVMVALFAVR